MRRVRAGSVTTVHVVGQGWTRLGKAANGFATAKSGAVTNVAIGNLGTRYVVCAKMAPPGVGGFGLGEEGVYPHTTSLCWWAGAKQKKLEAKKGGMAKAMPRKQKGDSNWRHIEAKGDQSVAAVEGALTEQSSVGWQRRADSSKGRALHVVWQRGSRKGRRRALRSRQGWFSSRTQSGEVR